MSWWKRHLDLRGTKRGNGATGQRERAGALVTSNPAAAARASHMCPAWDSAPPDAASTACGPSTASSVWSADSEFEQAKRKLLTA